jgi:hypothetical protein
MKKEPSSKIIRTEITTIYEFTTDDLENLIREKYNLTKGVEFNWRIGQWVSLDVIVKQIDVKTAAENPELGGKAQ